MSVLNEEIVPFLAKVRSKIATSSDEEIKKLLPELDGKLSLCSSRYISPLESRYSSVEMQEVFSEQSKFSTWRQLWVWLAESEKELGVKISDEQIGEMKEHIEVDVSDLEEAAKEEAEVRHDVMAHIHAFGVKCPKAKPIIHLGATSCFVGDNADLILIRRAFGVLVPKLVVAIDRLSRFCAETKSQPCLGYTHLQWAQPTTVGKRAVLWLQKLTVCLGKLTKAERKMKFRGCKGTTGTQASYMELFNDDEEKVRRLDDLVTKKAGFSRKFNVSGQTYPREYDYKLLSKLTALAVAAHKICLDIRLLAAFDEIEEPFGKAQVGSSAMPYKRNPMRCERVCSLAQYLKNLDQNAKDIAANQGLERTLDDSANRRIVIPQAFLCADSILKLLINIFDGLIDRKQIIKQRLDEKLCYMIAEKILARMVEKGGDRQLAHRNFQELAQQAKYDNVGLASLLKRSEYFAPILHEIDSLLDASKLIGRAPDQVDRYLRDEVGPILDEFASVLDGLSVEEPKV